MNSRLVFPSRLGIKSRTKICNAVFENQIVFWKRTLDFAQKKIGGRISNIRMNFVFALSLAAMLASAALPGHSEATTRRIEFTSQLATIASVGVMANGVALTSGVPVLGAGGIWYLDTHVLFGHATTIVAFDHAGNVSLPSNARTYGGCDWDRDGDGTVGLWDFSSYRKEYGDGDAELVEFDSFRAAFGLQCD